MCPATKLATFTPSSEIAFTLRAGITVATHDLVGIASAMELRLDVIEQLLETRDRDALRSLATQLRDATRTLRLLRGPDADDTFAPVRSIAITEWWRLAGRLGSSALPRGSKLVAELGDASIRFRDASGLTQLWMLACQGLQSEGTPPYTVTVRCELVAADARQVRVLAEVCAADWRAASKPTSGTTGKTMSKWERASRKLGRALGANVAWWAQDDAVARWSCTLPSHQA